uniref:DUF58 domain-containing protein n=1 Tax=Magnetococcus massalia (strain MO-1) TaxID=451514 RepID=A0A1S7LHK2_MAGMO|nr:conserved protein of unknown function [Candidatus Magnetococcus massalia]
MSGDTTKKTDATEQAAHPRLDELLELRHSTHTLGIASRHLVNAQFSGLYASVFRGQGLNFEEVREYRRGDDIRNMDWKVTARTTQPHLKVYREERERSVVLCVDHGPHMFFGTRNTFKINQAAQAAALLGWAANGQHDRVGGILFGNGRTGPQHFIPSKDRRSLWRMLRELAESSEPSDITVDCLDQVLMRADRGAGTGALIFVIADFNREMAGLEKRLVQLCQKHAVVLIPVDDPSDQQLPDMGQVLFTTPTGETFEVDTSDPAGQKSYSEQWQARRELLIKLANRLRVAVIPVSTDEDVHKSLTTGLRRRAQSRAFM